MAIILPEKKENKNKFSGGTPAGSNGIKGSKNKDGNSRSSTVRKILP